MNGTPNVENGENRSRDWGAKGLSSSDAKHRTKLVGRSSDLCAALLVDSIVGVHRAPLSSVTISIAVAAGRHALESARGPGPRGSDLRWLRNGGRLPAGLACFPSLALLTPVSRARRRVLPFWWVVEESRVLELYLVDVPFPTSSPWWRGSERGRDGGAGGEHILLHV